MDTHISSQRLPILLLLAMVLLACSDKPPELIEFADHGADYASKPDFARVEYEYPLAGTREARADLALITPGYLEDLDQEHVDQIYARLGAGPIPDGAYDGELFFPRGISGKSRKAEIVGGLKGLVVQYKSAKLEALGGILWKGKVFYRDQRVLRNRIEDLRVLKPLIDGSLDSIPKIDVDQRDAWLMFPAKLFCGQSLLDGRRESVIIDYAYTDDIEGYRQRPDYLAGRRGFKVRDEIRMVYPGLYLGRAYLNRVFLLNFTLYNNDVADRDLPGWIETGVVNEDCEIGSQRLAAADNAD